MNIRAAPEAAVLAGGRGRIGGIPSTKGAKTPLIVPIVFIATVKAAQPV